MNFTLMIVLAGKSRRYSRELSCQVLEKYRYTIHRNWDI